LSATEPARAASFVTNGPLATARYYQTATLLFDWTALGVVTELAPGRFQFNDPQAANYPQRFYRARSAP
jgi:hypothetical protein